MNSDFNVVFESNADFSSVVGMEGGKNLVFRSAVEMNSDNATALIIFKVYRAALELEALLNCDCFIYLVINGNVFVNFQLIGVIFFAFFLCGCNKCRKGFFVDEIADGTSGGIHHMIGQF